MKGGGRRRCVMGWKGAACHKPGCPLCRERRAADWRFVVGANLATVKLPVLLVTLTAPGAETLPWDEEWCRWRGPHRHSGRLGCRVSPEALIEWREGPLELVDAFGAPVRDRSKGLEGRWKRLVEAAKVRAKRAAGSAPLLLAGCWELQRRGVPHVHVVVAATPAGRAFAQALAELAPRASYRFGFVDATERAQGARGAAAYLAKYVTKGEREAAILPRRQVWVSRRLTLQTRATMRMCRLVRVRFAQALGADVRPRVASDSERHALLYYFVRRRERRFDWPPYDAERFADRPLVEVFAELREL